MGLAWPTRSDMPKRVTIILAVLATRSRSLDAPVVTCVCVCVSLSD